MRPRLGAAAAAAALALSVLLPPLARAAPAEGRGEAEDPLRPEVLFADDAIGHRPQKLAWSPDGRRLAFAWNDGDGDAVWLLDVPSRDTRPLFSARRLDERAEPAIEALVWAPGGEALLVLAAGDLSLYRLDSMELRRLTETEAEESDPKFSPDGRRLAFVRDADLHLMTLPAGRVTALTTDGENQRILNGVTDWVYWEEIWGRDSTGFWWSPDGSRIAYYRFEEAPVGSYPLVDYLPVYPRVDWQKYPKAGTANPRVRLGVLELESRETVWLETGAETESYLARVAWIPGGDRLAVQRLSREQDRLDLLSCEAATGRCLELLAESWPTWVNLGDELTFLDDGGFLWGSERNGWRRLYHYDARGRLVRPVTDGGLVVETLERVDPGAGDLLFTGYAQGGLDPARRQVYRQGLTGGARPLGPERGRNRVLAAGAAGFWVHEWSDADTPPRQVVRDAEGVEVVALPAGPPRFDPAELPRWKYLTFPGPGSSRLPAMMLEPPDFDPARRYPVIMYHYGGPGSQVVTDRWDTRGRGLWHKWMARRGYLVFAADNEASLFFGKRGEDRVHRRFGEINLAAQLAAVEYLESLPYVDGARIGLWGWSGGGSNTLYCMLNRPGVWRAAVAGAPVTDWRLYDTIWTERYLDHPDANPAGYRDSSPITYADRLADALLVVHGTADDNVHPQNSYALFAALVKAHRPFESALYPGQKHALKNPALRHFYEKMTAFFDHHLRVQSSR